MHSTDALRSSLYKVVRRMIASSIMQSRLRFPNFPIGLYKYLQKPETNYLIDYIRKENVVDVDCLEAFSKITFCFLTVSNQANFLKLHSKFEASSEHINFVFKIQNCFLISHSPLLQLDGITEDNKNSVIMGVQSLRIENRLRQITLWKVWVFFRQEFESTQKSLSNFLFFWLQNNLHLKTFFQSLNRIMLTKG